MRNRIVPDCSSRAYRIHADPLNTTQRGGTRKNFDRDARVTFLGLKFHNLLFFGVAQNEGYFLGVAEKRNYRITPWK